VVAVSVALTVAGVLITEREDRLANDRLRIELATAQVRIGRLYVAQLDRARAAAAYAEAIRIAGSLSRTAQPDAALDALRAEMKQLEADLAASNPR
jgi:hypothetical protein